jgi:hypothetical protein
MDLFSDYLPPMTVAKAIRLSWASLANTSVLIRLILPVLLALCFCIGILFWGWPLIATKFVPYLQSFSVLKSTFGQLDLLLGFSVLKCRGSFSIYGFNFHRFVFFSYNFNIDFISSSVKSDHPKTLLS